MDDLRKRVAEVRDNFRRMKFTAEQWFALMQVFDYIDRLEAIVRAADEMATHIEGLLELKAVGTPVNTKHWLDNYRKARDE